MSPKSEYVPGVCNIGPSEIRRRTQAGWVGLVATILLWTGLIVFRVPAPWRLLLFIPAAISAAGFIQAGMHFCAAFGIQGVFNFGPDVGKTDTIEQAEFRRRDHQKAMMIILYSTFIGIVTAMAGYLLLTPD